MRIACVGNMNNGLFPIARYLDQIEDYDVTLFLLDEYDHFKPSADSSEHSISVVELGWNESLFESITPDQVKETFKPFDFFIGTDYSAAFLIKAGIILDIYFPAGTDLYEWPFKKSNKKIPEIWEIKKIKCARNQLLGIRNSKYISLDFSISQIEKSLKLIKSKGKRIHALPNLFLPDGRYENFVLPKKITEIYNDLLNQSEMLIIQHCRQAWDYDKNLIHYKGNDILIKGFANFTKKYSNVKLILVEYGEHIENSKDLIANLKIEGKVVWLPKMPRKFLMQIIKKSHIGVGELGHSWLSYGAVYEALACKVAFMGYREDALYKDSYDQLYSMINVSTPEEVADRLEYYYHNREELATMGEQGHDWLLNYAINPSVEKVLEIIKNHKGRKKLPIDWKLVFMQPYFIFIRIYNVFAIKFKGMVNRA